MIETLAIQAEHDRLTWTCFWDMSTGGYIKVEPYDVIYIQAPRDHVIDIFAAQLGRSPYGSACYCCGDDFDIEESDGGLARATAYQRRVKVRDDGVEVSRPNQELFGLRPLALTEYCEQDDVLVIYTRERGEEI